MSFSRQTLNVFYGAYTRLSTNIRDALIMKIAVSPHLCGTLEKAPDLLHIPTVLPCCLASLNHFRVDVIPSADPSHQIGDFPLNPSLENTRYVTLHY